MDRCDRVILETVAHRPWYKSEICRTIDRDTSTGAISRRVDTLVEDGYLVTTPVSPDHFDAGFLDGYEITEQGRHEINEKSPAEGDT